MWQRCSAIPLPSQRLADERVGRLVVNAGCWLCLALAEPDAPAAAWVKAIGADIAMPQGMLRSILRGVVGGAGAEAATDAAVRLGGGVAAAVQPILPLSGPTKTALASIAGATIALPSSLPFAIFSLDFGKEVWRLRLAVMLERTPDGAVVCRQLTNLCGCVHRIREQPCFRGYSRSWAPCARSPSCAHSPRSCARAAGSVCTQASPHSPPCLRSQWAPSCFPTAANLRVVRYPAVECVPRPCTRIYACADIKRLPCVRQVTSSVHRCSTRR